MASGGKVHHGGPGSRGDSLLRRPRDPKPPAGKDKFGALNPPNDGYALQVTDEQMSDYKVAQWAIDQWEQGSYGELSRPQEITDYLKDYPAREVLGDLLYEDIY